MDVGYGHQMGAVFLIEIQQIGFVLEEVGIQRAFLQGVVGQYIIIVNGNLKIVAFLSKLVFYKFEYLAVRCSCCTDLDNVVCVCCAFCGA